MIKQRFETSDGKLFDTPAEAQKHELYKEYEGKIRDISHNLAMYSFVLLNDPHTFINLLAEYLEAMEKIHDQNLHRS